MKNTMDPERRQTSLERKIQYIEQEIERQQKARSGVEQLAKVYQEQPDFVDEKGADDVNRQLIEVREGGRGRGEGRREGRCRKGREEERVGRVEVREGMVHLPYSSFPPY